jgi:hypothetical protein
VNVKHANQQFLIVILSFGVRSCEMQPNETLLHEMMLHDGESMPHVSSPMSELLDSESAFEESWPIPNR